MERDSASDEGTNAHAGYASGALEGARILIARSPDRAGDLVAALRRLGAEPVLLPLIDFEVARDQHSLDVAFDALGAGAYNWLVISSATTVQVLEAKAAERGSSLAAWLPGHVQVATIGPATRQILESRGISVDLAPTALQSGAGLLGVWPEGRGSVLLPQADIADPRLRRGLERRGASVQAVTAYRTVDYPADPRLGLPPAGAARSRRRRRAAGRRPDSRRSETRGPRRPARRRRCRVPECGAPHPRGTRPARCLPVRRDRALDGGGSGGAGTHRRCRRRGADRVGPRRRRRPFPIITAVAAAAAAAPRRHPGRAFTSRSFPSRASSEGQHMSFPDPPAPPAPHHARHAAADRRAPARRRRADPSRLHP